MDDRTALAAARAFGTPAGPLRQVRGGPSPLFDVTFTDGRRVALRVYDRATDRRGIDDGLRTAEALADAGLATPWPQRTRDGALTATVGPITTSALHWIAAAPPLQMGPDDHARLHAIGTLLADFHLTAAAVAPVDLHLPDRSPAVHAAVLSGDPPLTGAAEAARAACTARADTPTAIILDDPGAVVFGADGRGPGRHWLIGIDRAGRGWRAQDLAAALWPHVGAPDLRDLHDALLAGYAAGGGSASDAAPDRITLCLLVRALRAAADAPDDREARARVAALADALPG